MSPEHSIFADIVVAVVVAFLGGLAAHLLRLPLILGYLASGIIVGPNVVGVIGTTAEVQELAEFGVVLLLFAVGVEISFKEIRRLGPSIIAVALGQIMLTVAAGFGVGTILDWTWEQSLILGFMISLSSTMVVLKTLMDRGELMSLHGRLLTSVMLIQDLAFVVMIATVQGLGEGGGVSGEELATGLLLALAALALMMLIGPKVLPLLLRRIAGLGERELFLLSLIAITFGAAGLTQEIGLSAAVGAFLAGLALSGSDYGYRALSETVPLKDIFGALFFVSLGMLADPGSVTDSPATLFAIIGAIVGIKFVLLTGLVRAAGYLPYVAVLVGFGAGQMGEFSFVLAERGASLGVISDQMLSLLVMSAVITMAMTPALFSVSERALGSLGERWPALRPYDAADLDSRRGATQFTNHAIVAGLGRVGSLAARTFSERDLPFVAIEMDPRIVSDWRDEGRRVVNGSSGADEVLLAAGIADARLLIVAIGDERTAFLTAERARALNPDLDIVVRAHWGHERERLNSLGVNEVVLPEVEGGMEIIRHALLRFGTPLLEAEQEIEELREVEVDQQHGESGD